MAIITMIRVKMTITRVKMIRMKMTITRMARIRMKMTITMIRVKITITRIMFIMMIVMTMTTKLTSGNKGEATTPPSGPIGLASCL